MLDCACAVLLTAAVTATDCHRLPLASPLPTLTLLTMSNYPPPHHQYPSLSDLATPSSEHPQDYYSSTTNFVQSDYSSPHDDQNSLGNLRRDIYPPTSNQDYEKAVNPVTRGSIAAQMAAEGQIPKKEGLRMWRSDEHAGALMKGGRLRCCGRVCCCSIILVILILVSIVAAFLRESFLLCPLVYSPLLSFSLS